MKQKETQPLKPKEVNKLLTLLLRLSETGDNEVVRRLAKSLLNIVSRDKIKNSIEY